RKRRCDFRPGARHHVHHALAEESSHAARREPMTNMPGTGHTVLVVDDDADFCASMRELLVGHGYAVETTGSGRQALELLANPQFEPSAVIVDLRMPEMDGY